MKAKREVVATEEYHDRKHHPEYHGGRQGAGSTLDDDGIPSIVLRIPAAPPDADIAHRVLQRRALHGLGQTRPSTLGMMV